MDDTHGDIIIDRVRDVQKISEILREFDHAFPRRISERIGDLSQHAKKLSSLSVVLTARHGDMCAGFAAFYANDRKTSTAFLVHLAVSDRFRRKKLGRLLLERCVAEAKANGMTCIKLEVDTANNAAINFYREHGFSVVGSASEVSLFMLRSKL